VSSVYEGGDQNLPYRAWVRQIEGPGATAKEHRAEWRQSPLFMRKTGFHMWRLPRDTSNIFHLLCSSLFELQSVEEQVCDSYRNYGETAVQRFPSRSRMKRRPRLVQDPV
jgi:hypothetical protein